ncbi:ribbon-helix-helix protein, CopG family [Candidatus Nomurabacteria bacterium]|nr:ribbon-helix-helix protein, CopG family [Candidatus Kaiserbacteria bacterium]MCB9813855.1 ribbon-helix-helix protein, CopG family [Candidatus Nomurabacteria bacterium]
MSTKTKNDAIISVRTDAETRTRLARLAKATNRSRSSLVAEALEQYVSHQDWLSGEIERGVAAADRGELVSDDEVAAWIKSLK